jgi:RHS repeat-associated protein
VIRYDALGRVIRTDLPNGTYSSVLHTPWLETASDPNDNVMDSAWRTARLPGATPTPSAEEQRALTLTVLHAATPTKTHLDTLGRAFLVIAHNKIGGTDDLHETRSTLDIEGQVLEVKDPLAGRTCQTHTYSLAGKLLREVNIDKGTRTFFHTVDGALSHRWDSRLQVFRTTFDVLRRPTHLFMKPDTAPEVLLQRTVYGDSSGTGIADPKVNNLRGKPIRVFDGAGRIRSESYDFKGNSLSSDRRLATAITTVPDWTALSSITNVATLDSTAAASLETETFAESRTFDALNRIISATAPDGSIFLPTYNEAGLLEKVDVRIRGSATVTPFVANINYDAKGQRTDITYSTGNFKTVYTYDPLTFRLKRVLTTRISPAQTLQDLKYTFDPVGNIVEVTDAAQQALLFTNAFATIPNKYVYDAVYRLIEGKGREHKSVGDTQMDFNDQAIWNLPHPNDPTAIRGYTESYTYDKVGNILSMFHDAGANTWTRTYTYAPLTNNRLVSHNTQGGGSVTFGYDVHGSMTSMAHLSAIAWTPFDQMQSANLGGGGNVYFTYGAGGDRVRKVRVTGALTYERIYLGSYEIYREKTSGVTQLERQTLHVMDGAKRLAMVETRTVPGPVVTLFRYQLGNHLGSAVLETDEAGLVISYEEYTPYGSSAYRSSRSGVDVSARRYRYVGLERDDETGLYAMGARYYAAWLGRWTSADPLGIGADGPGVYNYTRGSPVNRVDPGGMDDEDAFAVDEAALLAKVRGEQVGSKATGGYESSRFGGEWIAGIIGGSEGSSIYTAVTKAWKEDTAEGKSTAEKVLRAGPLAMPGMAPARIGDALGSATRGLMKGDSAQATERGVDAAVETVGTYGGPVIGKIGGRLLGPLRPLVARLAIGAGSVLGPSAAQAEKPVLKEVAAEASETIAKKTTAAAAKQSAAEEGGTAATTRGREVFRELSAADRAALDAGEPLRPRGVGGTIGDQVAGSDTGFISASLDEASTARFRSGNGLVAIDVDAAMRAGAGYVEHGNVLSFLRRIGDFTGLRNAERAREVLLRGSVPNEHVRFVRKD